MITPHLAEMYEPPFKDYNENWERIRKLDYRSPHCWMCKHFGTPHHVAKHRGGKYETSYECALHPGTYNTRFSLACTDFDKLSEEQLRNAPVTHWTT